MGGIWFWWQFFFGKNQDALLQLPAEIKQIIAVALILALGGSLISKTFGFLKYVLLVIAIYFGLTYFGIV